MTRVPARRIVFAAAATSALALAVSGFSTSGAASAATHATAHAAVSVKGETFDVVVGVIGAPFYQLAAKGAEAEGKKLGVKVDFTGAQDFTQPEQTTILNTLLADKPAGLVIAPVDPVGVNSALKSWVSAKIPIATFDSTITGATPVVTRIASQNFAGGVAAAKALAKSIGGSGEVGIIGLNTSDVVLSARSAGFEHEIKVAYPKIKVVDSLLVGSTSTSIAESDAQSLVNKFSGLKAIFTTYYVGMESAASGIKQLGDAGKVKIAGFDGDTADFNLVKTNVVQVLVQQQPAAEAAGALEDLILHIEGRSVPKSYDYPMVVVTPANVKSMSKYAY